MWLKELNLLFKNDSKKLNFLLEVCVNELNTSQRIVFFFWKNRSNYRTIFMTHRIEPCLKIWLKNCFFTKTWLKELNLVSKKDSKNWTFFLSVTQIIEPFGMWLQELNLFFFWMWLKELNFFWTWLQELNFFFFWKNETLRNEPFSIWLKDWIFSNMTQRIEYDSKVWTSFSRKTQRIEPLFDNMTQRIELFVISWLKELNSFW